MKRKLKVPKPRNPVASFATRSGAGVHGKSKKALRLADKMTLKKEWTLSSVGQST
jgi:hypothetical protein